MASTCNRGAGGCRRLRYDRRRRLRWRKIDDVDRLGPLPARDVGRLGSQANPAVRDQSGQRYVFVELADRTDVRVRGRGRSSRMSRRRRISDLPLAEIRSETRTFGRSTTQRTPGAGSWIPPWIGAKTMRGG